MAFINKTPKKTTTKNNQNKFNAQKLVYNTPRWKSLRMYKLHTDPLCERCKEQDRITPATEVHHIVEFMSGNNVEQILWLGFDFKNLMSICVPCHQQIHSNNQMK